MNDLMLVIVLAMLPAGGVLAGGLLAEVVNTSRRTVALALHLATGILFGVIAIELAPEAFEGAPTWLAALAFIVGGATFIGLEALVERITGREHGDVPETPLMEPGGEAHAPTAASSSWIMIYVAVAIDLFADGLLIGTGSTVSLSLALVLGLGQVTADLPEGFATVANFKDKGVERKKRILLSFGFVIPVLAGALLSYFVLRDMPEYIKYTALAFTTGLLLVAASEEIIGEAHQADEDSRASIMMLVIGFALFAVVAGYLEG